MNDKEQKEELQKELEELAPGFPKKFVAITPSGYFDALPDHILERWRTQQSIDRKKLFPLIRMIAVAALVTGICFSMVWWTHQSAIKDPMAELNSAEAIQYILDHMDEFEPLILQQEQWADDEKVESLNPNEIEQYLLEEIESDDFENIF